MNGWPNPAPFPCPVCGENSRVFDIGQPKKLVENWRRRECQNGHKFTTREILDVDCKPKRTLKATKTTLDRTIAKLQSLRASLPG